MKRLIACLTIVALMVIPQFAFGSDLDDLKKTSALGEKLNASTDPNDIDAYVNLFAEEFVIFDAEIPFHIPMTRDMLKQSRTADITKTESMYYIPGDEIIRVVGDTGIISKYGTMISKPKGKPEILSTFRATLTLSKIKGKWLIIGAHVSKMPLGN